MQRMPMATYYSYAPTTPELIATAAGRRIARQVLAYGLTDGLARDGYRPVGPVSRPYLHWVESPFEDGDPILTVRVEVRVAPLSVRVFPA